MKSFLIQVAIFISLIAATLLFFFIIADGSTDAYYARFTSPQQHSLIIGTSRSAQGLRPSFFNERLSEIYKDKIFNYSFTLRDSPFGQTYLESIQKKINPDTEHGLFVVTVDPWSISGRTSASKDSVAFSEVAGILGKTKYVNMKPNIPYFITSYEKGYIEILKNKAKKSNMFIHEDGWLEITVPMDSIALQDRINKKLKTYKDSMLRRYKFSSERFEYLEKTIAYLQNYGTVYVVRLPIPEKMFDIEDLLLPDFEEKMNLLSLKYKVNYKSYKGLGDEFLYTDGNHLYKNSGEKISRELADWIYKIETAK